ncbi:M48 family metallopeptidase [Maridesulfovibrio ferrireducens]|uniref:M48 family metallopeptidase n=1 Tax=Maridesulfovibrio ferrireducens TaxID=246191 RepID=UPI001A1DF600|nr:M48 family metallopeptidase [Maridesulfovibrio ferrireducens]MBI9110797.1 M48 family metallopeptidase [Maridesulfovibrio ferrireducens]
MNIYFFIIIFSLTAVCLLGLISRKLNRSALSPELPEEFKGTFNADKYRKSQDYTKAGIGFENISSTFMTLVTLLFIICGGFNILDIWATSFGYNEIITGLIFFAGLAILSDLISLPFSLYQTFVIEEKFGFNKTNLKTFFMDKIKGYLLGGIIGGILLSGILLFFSLAGQFAWAWCWLFIVVVTLAIQYIAPTWILPLFNKFTPLEEGELKDKIGQFAKNNGFEISGIFMIDGSKRSTKANAYFTGFGKKKRIALFDTLIKELSTDEIVAVLAHEIGHSKLGHIRKMIIMSIINTGIVFLLMSFFLGNKDLFAAFGMQNISIHAGLIFFALLYTPVSVVLSVFSNAKSRKHEFEADNFAAKTTKTPSALIGALKKLSASNLSNLTPHPFYVWLEYSHPPVLKRIENLKSHNA